MRSRHSYSYTSLSDWTGILALPPTGDPQLYAQLLLLLKFLILIMVANGAPILIRIFLQCPRFDSPLDFNVKFFDGRPVLGHSKTIRGFVTAILVTPVIAFVLGLTLETGFVIALFSMFGDVFSSFIKRRLDWPPSSRALGLDQVPESLFPLLAIKQLAIQEQFTLPWQNIVLIVLVFFALELLLSKILYLLKIRKRPY